MNEKELYDMKWFDYRAMDPDTATLVFMHEYALRMREYNELLGRSRYFYILKSFKAFERDYLRNHRLFKILEKLRPIADKHGMPYDKFWEFACEAHMNLGFKKTYVNVFLNKNILKKIKEDWEQYKKDFICYSKSTSLQPDNYQGFDIQKDYYEYLLGQIKTRYPASKRAEKLKLMLAQNKISKDFLLNR